MKDLQAVDKHAVIADTCEAGGVQERAEIFSDFNVGELPSLVIRQNTEDWFCATETAVSPFCSIRDCIEPQLRAWLHETKDPNGVKTSTNMRKGSVPKALTSLLHMYIRHS